MVLIVCISVIKAIKSCPNFLRNSKLITQMPVLFMCLGQSRKTHNALRFDFRLFSTQIHLNNFSYIFFKPAIICF